MEGALGLEPIRHREVESVMDPYSRERLYRAFYGRFQSPFEPKPLSIWARIGIALITIAVLAVSFMLGLVFLAVAVGLVAMALIALGIRRLIGGSSGQDNDDIEVTYRVVDRREDRD